jgi:hypothetical protein
MTIEMLEAISDMMKETKEIECKCAKVMLDKVITGLKKQHTTLSTIAPIKGSAKVTDNVVGDNQQYQVIVGSMQELIEIKGLGLEEIVEIDGKHMTYEQAIGKNFSSGRIV